MMKTIIQTLPIIKALEAIGRKLLTIKCPHCEEDITLLFDEKTYPVDEQAVNEEYFTDQTIINHRAKWATRLIED